MHMGLLQLCTVKAVCELRRASRACPSYAKPGAMPNVLSIDVGNQDSNQSGDLLGDLSL